LDEGRKTKGTMGLPTLESAVPLKICSELERVGHVAWKTNMFSFVFRSRFRIGNGGIQRERGLFDLLQLEGFMVS
jgi:hypothetical protein